ncbi:tetratricopeptide repeat protein [Oceaniglobus ichthyenteri]|uniref:tetratricopeptide repeat protein n=1 Tax=Oceaniglobus ichthyenteri TaxID=2136177 RepID=UPI000D35FF8B|nr:tetratricopeptide repeat protein [Oceaniglobus ichthyenteri]
MPVTQHLRFLALAAGLGLSSPVWADVNAGAYLAGRTAATTYDFAAASQYFAQALLRDPGNPQIMELANTAYLGLGDVDRAVVIARQMIATGDESQIANLVLLGDAAANGKWGNIIADLDAGQTVGPLFDGLLRGWAMLEGGDIAAAVAQFDVVSNTQGVQAFGQYHKGLALAATGDFAAAADVLADPDMRLTRRGLVARAQILSQLGEFEQAITVLRDVFGQDVDRALEELITTLEAGEAVPFDITPNATAGVAEVFFSIANALSGEPNLGYTLFYARMVEHLRPDHVEGMLLTAGLLEQMNRFDLAIAAYGRVPRDHPASDAAQLGRAEALRKSGRVEAAIEAIQQVAQQRPDLPVVYVTLGDTLREQDRFDEAAKAYDQAVALLEKPAAGQWIIYFARAITYERTDRWPEAEADFRTALELNPDQPQVLNYLGYSYVEKQQNLDEALAMIERAVAASPDSGYITDSLGWVFYRLGRYDEAVAPMERAVELMPVDPVINDHLGDVYWAVGRKLEAQFQWKRALSFIDPADTDGEADPVRIKRKLEVGLDVVLQEEGAPPLTVANDDG